MVFDGFRKIICPFCAKEYRLGDLEMYSQVTRTVIKEAPKNRLESLWAGFRPGTLEGKENVVARKLRRCPNCHTTLPPNIEYVDQNIIIAVIGDGYSGKSHFIAAAIQQLKEGNIPPEIGLLGFSAASSETEDTYRNKYYDPLFQRNEQIPGTPIATKPLDEPLIYEMRFVDKRVNLLIYDAAGADIRQIDVTVPNKPHILNAHALIFLADPWSMPGFVNQLAHHLRPDPKLLSGRTPAEVLNNVIEVFKRALGQSRDALFSLPVAIVVPKSDLIPYVITRSGDSRYSALPDTRYRSQLNRGESEGIHLVVRQLLLEIGQSQLVAMERSIERLNFSAITATGTASDSNGKYLQPITPHRCLDPIFWILRELEVAP